MRAADGSSDDWRDREVGVRQALTPEGAATARASLQATIACLDELGLDLLAAHASLALERLNELYPPDSNPAAHR